MRSASTPYAADWIAISLRWLFLLAWVGSRPAGEPLIPAGWPALVLLAWNMAMTALAIANARLPGHRIVVVALDFTLIGLLLFLSHTDAAIDDWVAALPVLTSAVYYGLLGTLPAAALLAALVLVAEWTRLGSLTAPVLSRIAAGLITSGLMGAVVSYLVQGVRSRRRAWLDSEQSRRRAEGERLRAIYELTSALTATLSYRRVLDAALDLSYSALGSDEATSDSGPLVGAVLLFHGDRLRVAAARRFTAADSRVELAAAEGVLKQAFEAGESLHVRLVQRDPELGRVIALRSCRSAYCFPLRTGFNVYGVLLFAHPDATYFTAIRREMLDIIGRQAAIAIQNARLYQDLVQEKERMVEVHEEARKKLARDLHDGPTQSVAAMAMRISMIQHMLSDDPAIAGEELEKVAQLAERAGKEIRHTLFTLRPLILESQGLAAAVRAVAEKMRETFGQHVAVDVDDRIAQALEAGKQGLLFYIIEEAMSNSRKHANAPNIWVRLRAHRPGIAMLQIEDDGVGFDVSAVAGGYEKRSSLGLINLRERAELVNGVLDIRSVLGRGTRISVYVPLTREAAERLQRVVAAEP
jgi:signal transduction histidine kinase